MNMKQTVSSQNPPAKVNGHNGRASAEVTSAEPSTQLQARELTSLFLKLTRQLLAVDDLAADLPLRQLRVCMQLYEGPRSMTALSRELGVSLSAMTQIADRLERARLVKRSFEGSDRRVRSLQLTPRGQKLMQQREQARIKRAAEAVSNMQENGRTEVLCALRRLLAACCLTNIPVEVALNGVDQH
ncbi:MAG TPA: MarR family transcriptional regulator [Pirellulales bacterium]|jgi:DNA-binding MarR family transcriptional regulator